MDDSANRILNEKTYKVSYTVPCSSAFRDAVTDLARRRQSNVADLARSDRDVI